MNIQWSALIFILAEKILGSLLLCYNKIVTTLLVLKIAIDVNIVSNQHYIPKQTVTLILNS